MRLQGLGISQMRSNITEELIRGISVIAYWVSGGGGGGVLGWGGPAGAPSGKGRPVPNDWRL